MASQATAISSAPVGQFVGQQLAGDRRPGVAAAGADHRDHPRRRGPARAAGTAAAIGIATTPRASAIAQVAACSVVRSGAAQATPTTPTMIAATARYSRRPRRSPPACVTPSQSSTISPLAKHGWTTVSGANSSATISSGQPDQPQRRRPQPAPVAQQLAEQRGPQRVLVRAPRAPAAPAARSRCCRGTRPRLRETIPSQSTGANYMQGRGSSGLRVRRRGEVSAWDCDLPRAPIRLRSKGADLALERLRPAPTPHPGDTRGSQASSRP